jgi:rare lipoprotein A
MSIASCAPAPCSCPVNGGVQPAPQSTGAEPEPVLAAAVDVPAKAQRKKRDAGPPASVAHSESELLARYEGSEARRVLKGKATYYGDSLSGHKTANGDVYSPREFTAAHRTLPFNTIVRVVREDTQRYVYVRINDRGPFGNADRIIDLSKVAAERLGMLRAGVVRVRVEVLE